MHGVCKYIADPTTMTGRISEACQTRQPAWNMYCTVNRSFSPTRIARLVICCTYWKPNSLASTPTFNTHTHPLLPMYARQNAHRRPSASSTSLSSSPSDIFLPNPLPYQPHSPPLPTSGLFLQLRVCCLGPPHTISCSIGKRKNNSWRAHNHTIHNSQFADFLSELADGRSE